MNRYLILSILLILTLSLSACGNTATDKKVNTQPLKVGVTAGPHAEIFEVVKKEAEKNGLKINVIEFNDYIQPNVALSQGDIDVNCFQHKPYMDYIIKDRKYDLHAVANTVIFPMGLYSKKITDLKTIPENAIVGIPNDPTNGARGLLLLEQIGLIKLKEGVGIKASPADIIANVKNIKIKELDAAIIPRSLADLDIAAVNTNYAMPAGLNPAKDALFLEDSNSPYVNVIAASGKTKDDPRVKELIKAYQSPEVKKFIENKYQKSIIAAW